MVLLFVLGVMNLWWIAALTLFVLAEKSRPAARWLPPAGGAALIAWGLWLIERAVSGPG
jgi:predicted metal-binding membrane protein